MFNKTDLITGCVLLLLPAAPKLGVTEAHLGVVPCLLVEAAGGVTEGAVLGDQGEVPKWQVLAVLAVALCPAYLLAELLGASRWGIGLHLGIKVVHKYKESLKQTP